MIQFRIYVREIFQYYSFDIMLEVNEAVHMKKKFLSQYLTAVLYSGFLWTSLSSISPTTEEEDPPAHQIRYSNISLIAITHPN